MNKFVLVDVFRYIIKEYEENTARRYANIIIEKFLVNNVIIDLSNLFPFCLIRELTDKILTEELIIPGDKR